MKELEFRTKDGHLMFSIHNGHNLFGYIVQTLNETPHLTKEIKNLGNDTKEYEDYLVYTCIFPFGYIISGLLGFSLQIGDYIKVIE